MAKILKNNTASDILISDTGVNILASSNYTIPPADYPLWAASSDIITYIGSGDITVNDGTYDLTKADGVSILQGNFKQTDFIDDLKSSDRLKVELTYAPGATDEIYKVKVSSNDTTASFLEDKIVGTSGKIVLSTLNDSGDEDRQINIGSDVFDKTVDDTGDIVEGSNLFFTDERAQDAVGTILTDTTEIDFTYNDVSNEITADLKTTGVSASSYGNATQVGTFTVDSKGRLTAASNTSIAIPSTQITDFNEAAQDSIGNILTDTASIDFTYNDGGNTISATVLPAGVDHNSLANLTTGDPHTQYINREANATVTDNAITRWDGTTGRDVQNSSASLDDNGGIIAGAFVRVADTSDTTNGNIRYTSTNTELLGRQNGVWRVLGINPTIVSTTGDTSTTSGTYAVISSMTLTPSAGTYMCLFTCTAALASDTTADIAVFINGVEDATSTRRLAIDASGILGATASFEVSVCIITEATVNGSQAIDIRFRENGGGTLTVGPRRLKIIPISR